MERGTAGTEKNIYGLIVAGPTVPPELLLPEAVDELPGEPTYTNNTSTIP